jgi:hypothetical protein
MKPILVVSLLCLTGCGWLGFENETPAAKTTAAPGTKLATGEKLTITGATWNAFQNYKYWLTPIAWSRQMGEGYFAVAKDGRTWGLTGCTANGCVTGEPVSQEAVAICETKSSGVPCVVFAHDQDIVVPYQVVD